jgi:hypothetical protein
MTTPKITEVNIKNLRGIGNLTLQDTRTFNLLVGPSEVGKTSVLEGIFIGSSFAYINGLVSINQFRGIKMDDAKSHQRGIHALFRNTTEKEISIALKVKKDGLAYSFVSEYSRVADENRQMPVNGEGNAPEQSSADSIALGVEGRARAEGGVVGNRKVGLKIEGEEIGVARPEFELKLKKSKKIVRFDEVGSYFPESHLSLAGRRDLFNAGKNAAIHKKEKEITRVLQRINPRIKKIEVIGKELFIDIGLPTMQPASVAGSGVIDVIFTLGILSSPNMTTLLLDEIGYGLYYGSLEDYLLATLRFAKAGDKQVFATTHRKDMLIALAAVVEKNKALREDVMCHVVCRNRDGIPRAYPYDHKTIRHCLKNNIEIR